VDVSKSAVPAEIAQLDSADPLATFRDEFYLPDNLIYLDGNSLGALPKAAVARLAAVVKKEWGEDLIRSWNKNDWIGLPRRVGGKIARLIGAQEHEVIATDSTSVNLFKLIAAAARLRPGRPYVVTEIGNFATDVYMIEGLSELLGRERLQLRACESSQLESAIRGDVALVLLTHVHYKTARLHDMARITALAHERGALALWDLSHSAGAMDVNLRAAEADFGVGCGYKYLNGGPGSPAFLFVAERHQRETSSPLWGWMGHAEPFAFEDHYRPADGLRRFLSGTPGILGLSALDAGLDVLLRADMSVITQKGRRLGDLFIQLVEDRCAGFGLELASPRDSRSRGCHVAFRHPEGYPIMQALIASGVIGDFRTDLLRFGFAPLYLRYADVWRAVIILEEILRSGSWKYPRFQERAFVT